jgi:DNA end-binding protein Ku
MASRPAWQGHLRLSLVSCPVLLYSATNRSAGVSFHLINPKTGNRIRMIATDPDAGPMERSDLVKGYEVDRDRYVTLTDEEIDGVRLESTHTLDIERFVAADEIDRLYWNEPYFLAPDGKMAVEAFGVIREAMVAAGKIAIGRLVLHTRERMLALEPRENGLVAWSLRSADEVRDPEDLFAAIPDVRIDPKMVDIASRIIQQQEGPFDPSAFRDRYEDALRALIAEKEQGQPLVSAPEPQDTEVPDLMRALQRSLDGARPAHPRQPATGKKAARPARPKAGRKARSA